MARAAVRTGNAQTMSTLVKKVVQTNIGIRMGFMPGARIFRMVTRKLIPVMVEPIPAIWKAHIQ